MSRLFVLAAATAAFALAAQTSGQKTRGTASIAGVVTAAGERRAQGSVSGAEVTLSFGETSRSLATGADGTFTFADLPAGRYVLRVSKAGYLTSEFGSFRPGEPGTPLAVIEGQALEQLLVPLSRPAVISGIIRTERGEPASNVRVSARTGTRPSGTTRMPNYEAIADSSGAYRISGLPPGEYVISAAVPAPGGRSAPVFFSGTADPARSGKVSVEAGEEQSGIDFLLVPPGTGRIAGTVLGLDGSPAGPVLVRAETTIDVINQVRSAPDGTFAITGLHAGTYLLRAEQTGPPAGTARTVVSPLAALAPSLWAQQSVDVPHAGSVDVSLSLRPTATWSGEIAFEDTQADSSSRLDARVVLSALDRRALPLMGQPRDGTFEIAGIAPGRYELDVQVQGDRTWWLKSAEAGGRSLLAGPLVVESDSGSLPPGKLILSRARSVLSGKLIVQAGQPATAYWVTALPADRTLWHPHSRRLMRTRPATNGEYLFDAIPVGDYLVAVFGDIHPNHWHDASFLASLSAQAVRVRVSAEAPAVQDLRITR